MRPDDQKIEFADACRAGLRPGPDEARNSAWFHDLQGALVHTYGLAGYHDGVNPLVSWMTANGVSVSWPFPQLIPTANGIYLLTETSLFLVADSLSTATAVTVLDVQDQTYAYAFVAGGGQWHCGEDARGIVWFQNATNSIVLLSSTAGYGSSTILAGTCCSHNLRIVTSGFSGTTATVYGKAWDAIVALLGSTGTVNTISGAVTKNSVQWSQIGCRDSLWKLIPAYAIYADSLTGNELIVDGSFKQADTASVWTIASGATWNSTAHTVTLPSTKTVTQSLTTVTAGVYVVGFEVVSLATNASVKVTFGSQNGTSRTATGYYFQEFTATGTTTVVGAIAATANAVVTNMTCRRVSAAYNLAKPLIQETQHRGDSGEATMPFNGQIYAVKALAKSVVVYGENGIAALTAHAEQYGVVRVADFGIAGRAAVAGDDGMHVLVSKTGAVWTIGPDLSMKEYDFRWLIGGLTDIVVTHDTDRGRWNICGKTAAGALQGFRLTGDKLSKIPECYTSYVPGRDISILSAVSFTGFLARTEPIDCRTRLMKNFTGLEVSISNGQAVTAIIEYKRSVSDSEWTQSESFLFQQSGRISFLVTGVEARVVLTASDYTNVSIDGFTLFWSANQKLDVGDMAFRRP